MAVDGLISFEIVNGAIITVFSSYSSCFFYEYVSSLVLESPVKAVVVISCKDRIEHHLDSQDTDSPPAIADKKKYASFLSFVTTFLIFSKKES